MVKIEMRKDGVSMVRCEGTLDDIIYELSRAICDIHAQISKADRDTALVFRQVFLEVLNAPNSPIWDTRCSSGPGFSVCIPRRK